MKFSLNQPNHSFQDTPESTYKWLEKAAIEAEHLGYESFWIMDHLLQIPPIADVTEPILESYVALGAIAAKTSRIRIGPLVTSNTFRNPAILAKMAATLDVVSSGRLFFGIGAGWFETEHAQYNIHFQAAGERIRRLEEAIQIIKKIWTDDRATFRGKYYEIKELICNPKPVQKPHPPILIGGGGEKLTLKIVAKYADACNIPFGSPDFVRNKLQILRTHCGTVGRNYDEILKTRLSMVILDKTDDEAYLKMQRLRRTQIPWEQYKQDCIWGSSDRCIDEIRKFADAGIDYLMVEFPGPYDSTNRQLFSDRVMSAFKP